MTTDRSKNPSSIVYWNDLENDEHLGTCSWGARGLWACKLLPIAARSVDYGVVQIGEHPCRWDGDLPVVLARASGGATPEVVTMMAAGFRELIGELITSGAASVDGRGRVFNRRMVRARKLSETRSEIGQRGAKARWGGDNLGDGKPMANTMANGVANPDPAPSAQPVENTRESEDGAPPAGCPPDGKPMPSSLSSLLQDSKKERNTPSLTSAHRADGAVATKREPNGTRLPEGWRPEGGLRQWTLDVIAKHQSQVSAGHELERFVDYWRAQPGAKGRKADWAATWRNWIRRAIEMEGKPNGRTTSRANETRGSRNFRTRAAAIAALGGVGGERPAGEREQRETLTIGVGVAHDDAGEGTT